jgi:hypothetical protein
MRRLRRRGTLHAVDWQLLNKTTIWVQGVDLDGADLSLVSRRVAHVLTLQDHELAVVDVRPGTIAFDVMRATVKPEWITGKEAAITRILADTDGVSVRDDAIVHSEGILGAISLPASDAPAVLERASRMRDEVAEKLARRAVVFASGQELISGAVRDLNSGFIVEALKGAGYQAEAGGVLPDDVAAAAFMVSDALSRGYGLVVTTGGIGAEDKDHARGIIAMFDRDACAAKVLGFAVDHERHHHDGVYVVVGEAGIVRFVALPGPTVEARLACARMLDGLGLGYDKVRLAEHIADGLREHWIERLGRKGQDDELVHVRR